MSLVEKVTAPFKFVENEFESAVNSLYTFYNKKTGRDQYSLANFYADGAFAYSSGSLLLHEGLTLRSASLIVLFGYYLGFIHRKNTRAGKLEENLQTMNESIKSLEREYWRGQMKLMGRFFLFLSANSVVDYVSGYSIYNIFGAESHITIDRLFNTFSSLLWSLSGYTSAIDTNNPKKSRIVSFAKSLLPQKVPELVPLPKKVSY